jgi:hypothetical protein
VANHADMVSSIVLMEPALRVRRATPATEDLIQRMSVGFQCYYRNGDREDAVDGFLRATFGPGYR